MPSKKLIKMYFITVVSIGVIIAIVINLVDFDVILNKAEEKVKEKVEEVKQEVQEKIDVKKEEIKKDIEEKKDVIDKKIEIEKDKIKNKLKGLINA